MKTTITNYYDRNTRRFLRFSPAGSSSTIHRAVWAQGVVNRTQAVHYVHELLLKFAPDSSTSPMVWDLGCGVGASMVYLANRRLAAFRGLTISGVQYKLATQLLGDMDCNIGVSLANFCDPAALTTLCQDGKPDMVYMIESFGHATVAHELIGGVADALQPGGRLIICDDLLTHSQYYQEPLVQRFRTGWGIETLLTPEHIQNLAKDFGLTLKANLNLTPFIENNRPRDRMIRRLVGIADTIGFSNSPMAEKPFWMNMYGGDALQQATSRGWIEYRFLVFEKSSKTRVVDIQG